MKLLRKDDNVKEIIFLEEKITEMQERSALRKTSISMQERRAPIRDS